MDFYVKLKEVGAGDEKAAKRRLSVIEGMPELEVSTEAEVLATRLLVKSALPEKAKIDALHIAVAARANA